MNQFSFDDAVKKKYDMQDIFTFGKYKGSSLEDVIYDDFKYIVWCLDNLEWFQVTEAVYEELIKYMDKEMEGMRNNDFFLEHGEFF
jgi:hypothetical protein